LGKGLGSQDWEEGDGEKGMEREGDGNGRRGLGP